MSVLLVQGDARALPLRDASVDCTVCSPPYWGLRSYGIGSDHGEIGLEPLHDCLGWARQEPPGAACCWICAMRVVFREVHRVLAPTGTLWMNCGDAYTSGNRVGHGTRIGYKQQTNRGMNGTNDPPRAPQPFGLREKNLLGLPWRLALALQQDGWYLRSEIIWHKVNPMPESVQDRPTRAHEHVFLFSKHSRYYFDMESVRESQTGHAHSRGNGRGPKSHMPGLGIKANTSFHAATSAVVDLVSGRAPRSVWSLASEPLTGFQHYAAFPTEPMPSTLRNPISIR